MHGQFDFFQGSNNILESIKNIAFYFYDNIDIIN